jgi:hypothetical protein
MKFAVVGEERREAQPGLSGKCPVCSNAMIAKCGEIKVPHWAHRAIRNCDPWWEPETDWHRAWKDQFPEHWQEFIQQAEDGERHIADVKTEYGVVVEFQHSFLRRDERESREKFYQKMVWVVNGLRRKRDAERFFVSVNTATVINRGPLIVAFRLLREGALLRDWGACPVPVYFDFGEDTLWRLNPCTPNGMTYLTRVPKTVFLYGKLKGQPFEKMASAKVERAAARCLRQQSLSREQRARYKAVAEAKQLEISRARYEASEVKRLEISRRIEALERVLQEASERSFS